MLLLRFTVFWVVFCYSLVGYWMFPGPGYWIPRGVPIKCGDFFGLELHHIFPEIKKKNERGTNVFLASG